MVHAVIEDGGIAFAGSIDQRLLEELLELAIARCSSEAADRVAYTQDALDAIDRYHDYEPDPAEVRELLAPEHVGDWRKVVHATGYIATREFLGAQVERDIDKLKEAVREAKERGYKAVALHASCPIGWSAHERETSWKTGIAFEWIRETTGKREVALSAPVSGGDAIWIQLLPIA